MRTTILFGFRASATTNTTSVKNVIKPTASIRQKPKEQNCVHTTTLKFLSA